MCINKKYIYFMVTEGKGLVITLKCHTFTFFSYFNMHWTPLHG